MTLQTLRNTILPGLDYPIEEMQALWIEQGGEGEFKPHSRL